jgi:hypothetical protein
VTFSTVVNTSHGARASNATTHVLNLPNGSNVVGRRVVLFVDLDEQQVITWPSGWTELTSVDGPSGNGRLFAIFRDIDGSEGFTGTGDTISCTVPATDMSSHAGISFEAGTFNPTAPEFATVSQATTGTDPNPPNLTPTGGALDYVWIAVGAADGAAAFTVYPTNYSSNQVTDRGGAAGSTAIAIATRNLNAAAENPGAFTIDIAEQRTAMTLAIAPFSAPAGGSTSAIVAALTEG